MTPASHCSAGVRSVPEFNHLWLFPSYECLSVYRSYTPMKMCPVLACLSSLLSSRHPAHPPACSSPQKSLSAIPAPKTSCCPHIIFVIVPISVSCRFLLPLSIFGHICQQEGLFSKFLIEAIQGVFHRLQKRVLTRTLNHQLKDIFHSTSRLCIAAGLALEWHRKQR